MRARSRDGAGTGHSWREGGLLVVLTAGVAALALLSFPLGSYGVATADVVRILAAAVTGGASDVPTAEETVVLQIRLPRIIGALLVGGGLAAAGAAYQSMFRNPLVSPAILGVSAGAGFGAALGILLRLPWGVVQVMGSRAASRPRRRR